MEKFNVVQFFTKPDGSYEYVRRNVSVEEAMKAFQHYASSVAVRMGIVNRVIITDVWDCVNAEWKRGEGITFPKKEEEARQ